jgi:hypothetical protein
MDILSLIVGFLVGSATGAAGSYYADKFTDKRRKKDLVREQTKIWYDIEKKFPSVIAEMREDFCSTGGENIRKFCVIGKGVAIGFLSEPCFEYDLSKHPDIQAAVDYLVSTGFVTNVTAGNLPMYRVHESLIDRLKRPNQVV